ncbi:MAG: hypothetical protein PWP62_1787 [Eubacteriaceae bacterium]|nr:hypothetical protein [Eubacteriaceae bacterium]
MPLVDEALKNRWILIKGSGVYDLSGKLTDLTGIFLDISQEKERADYIEHFARHDFLTGLPTRLDFEESLQKEIDAGHQGSLVMFDVDDFKSINDSLGHSFGDEILKQIADRLRLTEDENIYVARMGGDEFFVLLRNLTAEEAIISCIEDMYERISAPFHLHGIVEYLNFSMGVTIYPRDNNNIDQLMMNVDTAMYHVKRNGKNNYQFYEESMKKDLPEKRIAINYSAKQMRDKGYLQYLKNLLEEYGIKPENLEIEVTEGILLEKTESNMDFLREVRRLGLRLALDDFGSGYSSLSYLTFLPVNKIKLDKSINDKFLGMENIQVMQRIISLAHSLDLSITAEGIEEVDQFQKLKTCGWIRFRAIFLPDRSRPGRWKKFIIRFLRLMGWMSEASGGFVQQTEKNREKRKFFQLNEKTFFYLPGKLRERQSGIQDCCHQCP